MNTTNLNENNKAIDQELDDKSLALLKLIDDSIQQQYASKAGEDCMRKSENKYGDTDELLDFSKDYRNMKNLLLGGKVDEVKRELSHNRNKRAAHKRSKILAAIAIIITCAIFLIGPQRIYASIRSFGNALVRVFDTHTELEFDGSRENNLQAEKFTDISKLIPDDFSLTESLSNKNTKYVLFENADGLWISLNQSFSSNTALNFDSEDTNISEYMLQSISVTKYSNKTKTSFIWSIDDMSYLLSGNVDDKLLQELVDNLIRVSIEEN